MTKSELAAMLPKNSHDVEAARRLVAMGLPAVEPVLKSLFQWLETSGSDVEMVIRPFFASAGAPALPLIKDALKAPVKPARKYALLRFVLPEWPYELIEQLENELMLLVREADFYGLDVYALSLLTAKGVGNRDELRKWRDFKIDRIENSSKFCVQSECSVSDRAMFEPDCAPLSSTHPTCLCGSISMSAFAKRKLPR